METRWGGSEGSVRKALRRKGAKYGDLEAPYIIAVNYLSGWSFDKISHMAALFGGEEFHHQRGAKELEIRRRRDGFWAGPQGPRHTRVSAVLLCKVAPWSVADAFLCLYHNPWAQYPYSGELTRLPQAVPGIKMNWLEGVRSGELLGLAPNWRGE